MLGHNVKYDDSIYNARCMTSAIIYSTNVALSIASISGKLRAGLSIPTALSAIAQLIHF